MISLNDPAVLFLFPHHTETRVVPLCATRCLAATVTDHKVAVELDIIKSHCLLLVLFPPHLSKWGLSWLQVWCWIRISIICFWAINVSWVFIKSINMSSRLPFILSWNCFKVNLPIFYLTLTRLGAVGGTTVTIGVWSFWLLQHATHPITPIQSTAHTRQLALMSSGHVLKKIGFSSTFSVQVASKILILRHLNPFLSNCLIKSSWKDQLQRTEDKCLTIDIDKYW